MRIGLRGVRLAAGALLVVALFVGGCKHAPPPKPPPPPPEPDKTFLSVAARADVNPDASGRPSPVVLRVYQLKDDAAFKDADFYALFDKEQATLAASLIARKEFVLEPGDKRNVEFPVPDDAKFVAVVAAFRDIRNADWRALTQAPKKTFKKIVRKDAVSVTVEQSRVTLKVTD